MAKTTLLLLVAASLLVCCASTQAQIRSYTPPAGRALPNELQYFRNDTGVLDQFNQFVQPTQQLQNDLRFMSQQQQSDMRKVEQQIQQNKQIRPSSAAATGSGARFMNLSHFYGGSAGAGSRSGRRTR